jgi:hypothetical protein
MFDYYDNKKDISNAGRQGDHISPYSLVQISPINKAFTSAEKIQDVKKYMEYILLLISIFPVVKNK